MEGKWWGALSGSTVRTPTEFKLELEMTGFTSTTFTCVSGFWHCTLMRLPGPSRTIASFMCQTVLLYYFWRCSFSGSLSVQGVRGSVRCFCSTCKLVVFLFVVALRRKH